MTTGTTIPLRDRRTAVYRLFDAEGALLYVGITFELGQRWTAHSKSQHWWGSVATQKIEWHPCRADAEEAERTAIRTEKPKYNITYGDPEWLMSDEEQLYFEYCKRRIVLVNCPQGIHQRYETHLSPELVAPGTYIITLEYDPDSDPDDGHVVVSEFGLLHTEDDFAREWGAEDRRPPVPG